MFHVWLLQHYLGVCSNLFLGSRVTWLRFSTKHLNIVSVRRCARPVRLTNSVETIYALKQVLQGLVQLAPTCSSSLWLAPTHCHSTTLLPHVHQAHLQCWTWDAFPVCWEPLNPVLIVFFFTVLVPIVSVVVATSYFSHLSVASADQACWHGP